MKSSTRRILIADDYDDTAEFLAAILCLDGYDARAVHDGQQAVAMAQDFKPHCVVLDLNMPVMDGFEAASALRTLSDGGLPLLVALSGSTEPGTVERVRQSGFDLFLTKPPTNLSRSIARLLDDAARPAHSL